MADPADTIREALWDCADYLGPDPNDPIAGEKWGPNPAALAALTELEQRATGIANWELVAEANRQALVAAEADRDRLGTELTLAIQRNAEAGAEVARLREEWEDANREWSKAEARAEHAEAKGDEYITIAERLKADRDEARADRDQLQAANTFLRQDTIATLESKLTVAEADRDRLQALLNKHGIKT